MAQFYLRHKRIDEARAEFEGIAKRDPSAVMARTMVGMLLDQQCARGSEESLRCGGHRSERSDSRQQPAFIYAEQGINLDEALQLATAAKQRLPNDANVDDTIGWIYYKKGLFDLAIKPFEARHFEVVPDNPEVLFHLGLAHAQLGQK